MVIEAEHYTKALAECCDRVLDKLLLRLAGRTYREIVETTTASMGLQHSRHLIYLILEDSGAVAYRRCDRLLRDVTEQESIVSYDGVYRCPTTNRQMVTLTTAAKRRRPTEEEISMQIERHRERIDRAFQQERALQLQKEGMTGRAIAQELGLPYPTVCVWLGGTWEPEPTTAGEFMERYKAMFTSEKP